MFLSDKLLRFVRPAAPASIVLLGVASCSSGTGEPIDGSGADRPGSSTGSSAQPPGQAVAFEPENNECVHRGSGTDYAVGPGKPYTSLGAVPFENLKAGDTVRVYHRSEPYREKLMISGQGTAEAPIRICGVPGANGALPVIDGENATTRKELDFPFDGHQVRGLVIIGHNHDRPYELTPSYITLEGLEVRNATPPNTFTDKAGKRQSYSAIVAGIFIERAKHLTIRGCIVTGNGNGIFGGTGGGVELSEDLLLEGNYIHGNGSLDRSYEHNVYIEASNVVYQFNRFGPPRMGRDGNQGANIKERSAGVVIRNNYIEDGAHILDIVDAQEAKATTVAMPSFHSTHVYGNVIVRGAEPSGTLIHYGGDSGALADYRKGTLYFYNNTVVVKNVGYKDYTRTGIFELSTNEETVVSRNNVYFTAEAAVEVRPVGLLGQRDTIFNGIGNFAGDWMSKGITAHNINPGGSDKINAKLIGLDSVMRGEQPGFRDFAADDYALVGPGLPPAVDLPKEIPRALAPQASYVKHQRGKAAPDAGKRLGASVQ